MAPTAEQVEKFKKARAAMVADPAFLNGSISKLSTEAQVHAKAIRDIVINEQDPIASRTKITAIRTSLSPALLKEINEHRDRLSEKYGFPKLE